MESTFRHLGRESAKAAWYRVLAMLGRTDDGHWRTRFDMFRALIVTAALTLAAIGVYWFFEGRENARQAFIYWLCTVGVAVVAGVGMFLYFFVDERSRRAAALDRRHAALELIAEAVRLRLKCASVRSLYATATSIKVRTDRAAERSQLIARAEAEWKPIIPAAQALERKVAAIVDADPKLAARVHAGTRAFNVEQLDDDWTGVAMWAPVLEREAQKLVIVLDHESAVSSD